MPAYALSSAEGLGDFRLVQPCRLGDLKGAGKEYRARLVREGERLFGREMERAGALTIGNVAAWSLRRQPFADLTLFEAGLGGERLRSHGRAVAHGLVETEAIAKHDERTAEDGPEIADELAHESIKFFRIMLSHAPISPSSGGQSRSALR